ncbi:MAG: CDP-alcohol phosphatidyltransferase family protein [Candidatus Aminicenantales bacterium]
MNSSKGETFRFIPKNWIILAQGITDKGADLFIRLKFTPNSLSTLGMAAGIGAGLFFYIRRPLWAGILILICGLFDGLDGKVALKTERKSAYGAILDSSLDRYSEFFIFMGLALYFRPQWIMWLSILAFFGSLMVSYTRARAEGLGFECQIGIMQRAERLVLLILGSLVGSVFNIFPISMGIVLSLIVLFSNMTAFQRILCVKKAEKQEHSKKEG